MYRCVQHLQTFFKIFLRETYFIQRMSVKKSKKVTVSRRKKSNGGGSNSITILRVPNHISAPARLITTPSPLRVVSTPSPLRVVSSVPSSILADNYNKIYRLSLMNTPNMYSGPLLAATMFKNVVLPNSNVYRLNSNYISLAHSLRERLLTMLAHSTMAYRPSIIDLTRNIDAFLGDKSSSSSKQRRTTKRRSAKSRKSSSKRRGTKRSRKN